MGEQDLSFPLWNLQSSGGWKDEHIILQIAIYKPGVLGEMRDSGRKRGKRKGPVRGCPI